MLDGSDDGGARARWTEAVLRLILRRRRILDQYWQRAVRAADLTRSPPAIKFRYLLNIVPRKNVELTMFH